MVELINYRDINNVTVWVNPAHIVVCVLNRATHSSDWQVTINLSSGDQITLRDGSWEALRRRVCHGEAAAAP